MALTNAQSSALSATVAENAAAEAKSYAIKASQVENYSNQAKASAEAAEVSAASATNSAMEAEAAMNVALEQTIATIRVPDGETLSILPVANERKGKFPGFDPVTGDVQLIEISNTDAAALALSLSSEGGGELVGTSTGTVEDRFTSIEDALTGKASVGSLSEKLSGSVTFVSGGILRSEKDFIYNNADYNWYYWSGPYDVNGKMISPSSSPESSGGVGPGKWLNVGDTVLRSDLAKPTGAGMVGIDGGGTVQDVISGIKPIVYRSYSVSERLDATLTTSAMGAKGDGVTDDTAAIQLAINTIANFSRSASLYIDGRCKITGITIPATLSLTMVGNNPNGASYNKSALICTNTSGAAITVNGAACAFVDFQMVGASSDTAGGGDTTQTALLFIPGTANSYNCDAFVSGVGFVFFNKCTDLRGRNLKLSNCTFSNSAWAVWIGTTGIPDFRGLDIKNCRFHYVAASSGSVAVPLQSSVVFIDPLTKFFSIHISGNYCDGCKWFYVGALTWGAIQSNHLTAQQGAAFYIYNTDATVSPIFQKGSIQSNSIDGTNTAIIDNDYGSIHVENGWGIDIIGNSVNNAFKHGIYTKAANTVISGNTVKNASFNVSGGVYIRSSGNNTQILDNSVINLSQGSGTPSSAFKLEAFTIVDGNRCAGAFPIVWDTASRGDSLIYGEMKIPSAVSIEYGTAAPTSGRYLRGSVVININPSVNGIERWVCVGSGTPGAWDAKVIASAV